MTLHAWLTLGVTFSVLGVIALTSLPVDAILVASVVALLISGVLDPSEALIGFSNPGVLTIGALYVVAAGLQQTGAVRMITTGLLGSARGVRSAIARLVIPAAVASAFLNNTPIVAALLPGVSDWARRNEVSPSKLLMPLSFAAILGGTCTLIGTSTNLVVAGLVQQAAPSHPGLTPLSMFGISVVGVPLAIIGSLLMIAIAPIVLKARRPPISLDDDPRQFLTEMRVPEGSLLVGLTIEEAGLRHLEKTYIAELIRDDRVYPGVSPNEVLAIGDRLVFVGKRSRVVELTQTTGLIPAGAVQDDEQARSFVEVVVAPSNRLLGLSVREGRFRTTFGAVVIAAARRGALLSGRIGDVVLQPGDVLLLEATEDFTRVHRNRADFYLVNRVDDFQPLRPREARWATLILAAMVVSAATGIIGMLEASLLASGAMLVAGCCTVVQARRAIDTSVLIAIASAFAIGEAMTKTGLDQQVARLVLYAGDTTPLVALIAMYLTTMTLTEMITNNAAAVLAFPLALAVAAQLGVSPMPFVVTVMFAASASFLTPIGYQTNLMVYGPGGYRFSDYAKLGGILSLTSCVLTVTLVPRFWPF